MSEVKFHTRRRASLKLSDTVSEVGEKGGREMWVQYTTLNFSNSKLGLGIQ